LPAQKSEPVNLAQLRHDAEIRIKHGVRMPVGQSIGPDALSMLHTLSMTPESAVAALKLLHELQVHQIELDLQHEQLQTTQQELAEDLERYRGLFECAPVAFLTLSPEREILDCNIAGANLFEIGQDELQGGKLDSLLAPASRPVLAQLLQRLQTDGASVSCELRIGSALISRPVKALATLPPGGRSVLLVLIAI
jgi:PAS domain-containing protein